MLQAAALRTSPARGLFFLLPLTVQANLPPPHPKLLSRGHKSNIYGIQAGERNGRRTELEDLIGRCGDGGHTGADLSCLKGWL